LLTFKILEDLGTTEANIVIDTPGINYPIRDEECIQQLFSSNDFTQILLEKEASTAFTFAYTRDIADTIILTTNRTTFFDQAMVSILTQMEQKEIIVIHNFADVNTPDQLDKKIQAEIIEPFGATKETLQPFDIKVLLQQTSIEGSRPIVHLIMVNADGPLAQFNENAFNYVNNLMTTRHKSKSMNDFGPVGDLMELIKSDLQKYIAVDGQAENLEIDFDIKDNKLNLQLSKDMLNKDWSIHPTFPRYFGLYA